MLRWIVRALAIIVIAVATLVVLDFAELLVPVGPDDPEVGPPTQLAVFTKTAEDDTKKKEAKAA